jgi:hypothetical protein
METLSKTPRLIASTEDTYCCTIPEFRARVNKLQDVQVPKGKAAELDNEDDKETNYFKCAQW